MIVETKKIQPNAEKMELWMWYIFYWSFLREDMSICVQTCMFNFQSQAPMDQINFFKWKRRRLSLFSNTSIQSRCSDRWISEEITRRPPQSRSEFRFLLLLRRSHMFSGSCYAGADFRTRLPLQSAGALAHYIFLVSCSCVGVVYFLATEWVSTSSPKQPQPHPHPHHLLCLKMYFCPFSLALTPPQSIQLPLPLTPPPPLTSVAQWL